LIRFRQEGILKTFTLYGTSGCHLCEIAQDMLKAQRISLGRFDFVEVDISESDMLFERYGVTIPVLRHPEGRELKWPFSPQELRDFLTS
jgi:glutaredoxin